MKKIALAQMNIEYGNFERNVSITQSFINSAISEHCDLILFPELWSSGFDLHQIEKYASQNSTLTSQLQTIANQSNITICGSLIEKRNGNYFNSFTTIQPSQPITTYFKNHLFQLMHEDQYFTPGKEPVPLTTILGKTGMSICFDLRFPELFRQLLTQGVESYLLTSHWPLARIHHWDILLQSRAIENQAFMIAVNSVGQSGHDTYGGHSALIAPDGEILIQAPADEENIFITEIDPDSVKRVREKFVIQR